MNVLLLNFIKELTTENHIESLVLNFILSNKICLRQRGHQRMESLGFTQETKRKLSVNIVPKGLWKLEFCDKPKGECKLMRVTFGTLDAIKKLKNQASLNLIVCFEILTQNILL